MKAIEGLHHVTAITRDAQRNVDFYRNVLGQRLVKKTINFDDPGTYHFYFGDSAGTPGSVLTFFAWTGIKPGLRGSGAANALAYTVPQGSLGFWQDYLRQHNVTTLPIEQRFGAEVLPLDDPDGLRIELIGGASPSGSPTGTRLWDDGPVDPRYALQGFHSVTLWLGALEPTAEVLTATMGYNFSGQEGQRYRFIGGGTLGNIVDVLLRPASPGPDGAPATNRPALLGSGSIHHVAFRVPGDPEQADYRQALLSAGLNVTPVMDRAYFHSIYYREPGGVLFEIATETPGFAIDEPVETLGEALKLPPWLEVQRKEIEAFLPPIQLKPIQKAAYDVQK